VGAGEGSSAENDATDGTCGVLIGNSHVAATCLLVDGHLGNEGNAHAGAYHAQEAAELATLKDNLRMQADAIAGSNSVIAEAVTIAEQEERLPTKIFERKRRTRCEFVFLAKRGIEALGKNGKRFEFVAANGKGEDSDVDAARPQSLQKDWSDFFDHAEMHLGVFAGISREQGWQEVRSDGRDDPDGNRPAESLLAFDNIAASGFELSKHGAGARKESFAEIGQANGAAKPVKETRAKLVFEFENLLGKRRLRNVRLFSSTAEAAGFGDGAKIAELMEFHRLCLFILSELDIGIIGGKALRFVFQEITTRAFWLAAIAAMGKPG